MIDSVKRSSLQQYECIYGNKKFYDTASRVEVSKRGRRRDWLFLLYFILEHNKLPCFTQENISLYILFFAGKARSSPAWVAHQKMLHLGMHPLCLQAFHLGTD